MCFIFDIFNPPLPFPQDIDALAIALSMIGKSAIAIAFGLIYLYTCELYPTIIRSVQTGGGVKNAYQHIFVKILRRCFYICISNLIPQNIVLKT